MKKSKLIFIFIVLTFLLVGCGVKESVNVSGVNSKESMQVINKIDAAEAKKIMDNDKDIVILDVREENEYKEGHIKGSTLAPVGTIEKNIEGIVKDKDTKLLVYCRSGRRSAEAAKILEKLGYTKIYDFGGINDWPYEIEKN